MVMTTVLDPVRSPAVETGAPVPGRAGGPSTGFAALVDAAGQALAGAQGEGAATTHEVPETIDGGPLLPPGGDSLPPTAVDDALDRAVVTGPGSSLSVAPGEPAVSESEDGVDDGRTGMVAMAGPIATVPAVVSEALPFQERGEAASGGLAINVGMSKVGDARLSVSRGVTPMASIEPQGRAGDVSDPMALDVRAIADRRPMAPSAGSIAGDPPAMAGVDVSRSAAQAVAAASGELVASLAAGTPSPDAAQAGQGPASTVTGPGTTSQTTTAPVATPQAMPQLPMQAGLGQASWGDEFAQRIQWLAGHHLQRAELVLHPAHLGTVEVSIVMQNDHMQVSLQSQHPQVREAIEAALPRLREQLLEGGGGQTTVEVDVSARDGRPEGDANGRDGRHEPVPDGDHEPEQVPRLRAVEGSGLFDHYA